MQKKKLTSTSICLRACLCPAVGSILRTCDKPLCREWRQYTKPDFWENISIPFPQHTTIKPMEGTNWGPSFITFQSWDSNISLWPLARIRRPENATSMYVPKTISLYQVTSFHWAFSEQTCTRCEDGLPWIMLIWRLMWEKRSTSDSVIYVIIICTEGSVFATGLSENVSKWSRRAHWKSGIILSYSTFLATSSRQVRESCTLLCPICLAWHWVQATSVAMGYKYEMLQQ